MEKRYYFYGSSYNRGDYFSSINEYCGIILNVCFFASNQGNTIILTSIIHFVNAWHGTKWLW